MAHPTWPLFDLAIRTPTIELRLATEDEWTELVTHIDRSIYERTGFLPFLRDWPGDPVDSMKHRWRNLANWSADSWQFGATLFVDGEPLGTQGIMANRFGLIRSVSTGSWLLPKAQGRGFGTEMRTAILHFAFAGLGALEAHSGAHVDNAASNAVSKRLGYEFTHRSLQGFGDVRAEEWNMILRRETWEQHPAHQRDDIEIVGLADTLDWFIADAG